MLNSGKNTKKSRKQRRDKYELDSFDVDVIRRTVYDLVTKQKQVPTARNILRALQQSIGFKGKLTYLRTVLKEIGFVWKKCDTNRRLLMKRTDIVVARMNYLRKIKQFKDEGRPIIYTDETYVHSTHSAQKCWQDKTFSLKVPFNKGERLIVVHAVKGADLLFKSKTTSGDYHSEMNGSNFQKWLTEKLIPNLPSRSVVVVDNAPYHNLQHDKCSTQTSRKSAIIDWLKRNDIQHESSLLKPELLNLCKRNRPATRYILDETLKHYSHESLRLPQYHAEFNAIELIWSQVKGNIAANNTIFKTRDVMNLTEEAICSITSTDWSACCRHVQDVEASYWKNTVAMEKAAESFLIAVSDEEGTSTASETSDYSDTDTAFESQ